MMPACDLHFAGRDQRQKEMPVSKQKKPSADPRNTVIRIPLPPQKRQQASDPAAGKRKKFSDVAAVQQPLFELDQGGAR